MQIGWEDPTDAATLAALAAGEAGAKQRGRYCVVLLAGRGWATGRD